MRILQVSADKGVPPGGTKGASAHLRHVAGALAGRGHEVRTVARRAAESANPHPVPVDLLVGDADLDRAVEALGGVDLVYERYSLGHVGGIDLARRFGVPFVLEVNAPLVDEASAHRGFEVTPCHRDAEVRLFSEADVAMAVSTPLAAHVASVRGTDRGVIAVPNGADPAGFPRAARHDSGPSIVFLGHPKPWHGGDRLPHITAQLCERFPTLQVVVVGGGPGAAEILDAAADLGVVDRVRVTGPVAHGAIAAHLEGASIGIAPYPPSDFFYFSPLKVVEYMMAGLPVVTTDVGDVADTVRTAGIVVPPGSVDELVEACAYLLERPELRRHMGAVGRSRALTHHTWDAVAERIESAAQLVGAS
jgi:glycosyltransferase involved in cell wall biosynthesis